MAMTPQERGHKGGRPGQPKIDKVERARRLSVVEDLIASLQPRHIIKAQLAAKWGITEQQVGRYIDTCERAWARQQEPSKKVRREKLKRTADVIVRQGIATKRLGAAASALRMRAALDGIATDRVEHSGPDGGAIPVAVNVRFDFSKLTDEELRALRALRDKAKRE